MARELAEAPFDPCHADHSPRGPLRRSSGCPLPVGLVLPTEHGCVGVAAVTRFSHFVVTILELLRQSFYPEYPRDGDCDET